MKLEIQEADRAFEAVQNRLKTMEENGEMDEFGGINWNKSGSSLSNAWNNARAKLRRALN